MKVQGNVRREIDDQFSLRFFPQLHQKPQWKSDAIEVNTIKKTDRLFPALASPEFLAEKKVFNKAYCI